jgi:hypothetical protein
MKSVVSILFSMGIILGCTATVQAIANCYDFVYFMIERQDPTPRDPNKPKSREPLCRPAEGQGVGADCIKKILSNKKEYLPPRLYPQGVTPPLGTGDVIFAAQHVGIAVNSNFDCTDAYQCFDETKFVFNQRRNVTHWLQIPARLKVPGQARYIDIGEVSQYVYPQKNPDNPLGGSGGLSPADTFIEFFNKIHTKPSSVEVWHKGRMVDVRAGSGGTIEPSGNVMLRRNVTYGFLIRPQPGFKVAQVTGGCNGTLVAANASGGLAGYFVSNVPPGCRIEVSFTEELQSPNLVCNPMQVPVDGTVACTFTATSRAGGVTPTPVDITNHPETKWSNGPRVSAKGFKAGQTFVITATMRDFRESKTITVVGASGAETDAAQQRTIKGNGTLTAPGHYNQSFKTHQIDASGFTKGGTISISISVGKGESSASFDLFPSNVAIPTKGPPAGTLAGSYDIGPGGQTTLTYRFSKGQVFRLGATGNWFSKKGATNTYSFTATITGQSGATPAKTR